MTDPPTVPNGVTHVYITYNSLQVHVHGAGNESGWNNVSAPSSSTQSLDLMSVINASETIASANIHAGVFDALRLNITSVTVTYLEMNYSAYLVYEHHTLTVPVDGGVEVSAARTSAAMIDLTPTILLLGDPTNPAFAFVPSARGYVIPSQSIPANSAKVGERHDLNGDGWWHQEIAESSSFAITRASLTPTSLSITVENTGNASILFSVAGVTSQFTEAGGEAGILLTSQIFAVQSNGSLVAFSSTGAGHIAETIMQGGFLLAPGNTTTFTYLGSISIGALFHANSGDQADSQHHLQLQPQQQVVPGQSYVVTVFGNGKMAHASIVANQGSIANISTSASGDLTTTTTMTSSSESLRSSTSQETVSTTDSTTTSSSSTSTTLTATTASSSSS